ncbi:DNA polymerase-3 subunit gamma/tau [Natranaerovirga pectinivora]|uniref:DNA-directed DNA polymerase n=1 Tax=Natranaerovirga pectinivora TaxID=682400 RepID=A0A4R3MDE7_9FIRM|nr:DNA polymerase III subunit gamma/tau [Natranaerovirga pectinivora]TCT11660.1 DNA polymerase-3 subunit gamma/tau [Natranaerovirga pectinivora]
MSYIALYRKFRPKEFKDVIGQDHIVKTLTNQITSNRIGHAYLFNGTRGTGKTSTAKIFAKAVNCISPMEGSPCNTCEVCDAINQQKSMNIIEIDAASNNGVDNIRDIRDEVVYTPTQGKFKVYIIDEVHMLSIGAFNALLKTLEEPPEHVIFILATTEPHKIPITILSRCQRYDFKRISIETITKLLVDLMIKENIDVEEKALQYIAKVADGSMRDALSILDQCISFFIGQRLTMDKVLDILGAVDTSVFSQLLDNFINRDVYNSLDTVEHLIMQGRDLGQFLNDFIWYIRSLLITKTVEDPSYVLDMSEESILLLKEHSAKIDETTILRYIKILSDLSNQIKYSSQKRVLLEVAIINICQPEMELDYTSLIERLIKVESQLEKGIVTTHTPIDNSKREDIKPVIKERPKALTEDMKALIGKWPSVVNRIPINMKPYLKKTKPDINGTMLTIMCEDELTKDYLEADERKKTIKETVENELGKSIELQFKNTGVQESDSNESNDVYSKLQEKVNFEITYED